MSITVATTAGSTVTKSLATLTSHPAGTPSTLPPGGSREDGRQQPCTAHPDWCTEAGVHDAHLGARHVVMGNDGRELLDARLLDFSDSQPVIGLGETDTDAAEARTKARDFRKFADDLEILADMMDATSSSEQPSNPDVASCPGGVSFCTGDSEDHKDPKEHYHHGPLTAMGARRSYASQHGDGIMAFHLSQVNDEAPGLDFVADGSWPTLSLEEVDELISDMSLHLANLWAARAQLAGLMSRRRASQMCATPERTWTYDDRHGTQHTVTCPSWCSTTHTDDLDRNRHPADVHHQLYGAEASAEYSEAYEEYESWPLLCATLGVSPNSTVSPAYRVPHVLVEVAADTYTRPMDPNQLADFIQTVAGQLDELRVMHSRLTEARAEWATRTDPTTSTETA